MNFTQKTPVISGRGRYSVRAVEAAGVAATALRNTAKRHFEVSRYGNSQRV